MSASSRPGPLCDRDRKLDDSEFRADASDPAPRCRPSSRRQGTRPGFSSLGSTPAYRPHPAARPALHLHREMRKTLLVRAILARPALLILDSPLDGLDRASQQDMVRIIDELLHPIPPHRCCAGNWRTFPPP